MLYIRNKKQSYTSKTKNNVVEKAKGVSKVSVTKNISFDDDENCVLNDIPKNCENKCD